MAELKVPLVEKLVRPIMPKHEAVSFNGDCVDPFAKIIINEALDYAIEVALGRLKKAGKVVAGVETKGLPALQIVQGIRESLDLAPSCPRSLTQEEQDVIATMISRAEGESKAPRPGKEPPRPKVLSPVLWNTLPMAERGDLLKRAKIEGKRAGVAFGSFTTEEGELLKKAYVSKTAKAEKPKVEKPKAETARPLTKADRKAKRDAELAELTKDMPEPLIKLLSIMVRDPIDKSLVTKSGYGVLGQEGKQTGKITVEEGDILIAAGKAYKV